MKSCSFAMHITRCQGRYVSARSRRARVDPQDDVGLSGQDLHAHALYWATRASSNVLYVLTLQWMYVGWGVEGNALFQDSF